MGRKESNQTKHRVWCIHSIFFEVGIPNLVCGCILGWQNVAYHFWVTATMTSDIVIRIILSVAFLLYYLSLESQIWCVVQSVMYQFWGHCDLDLVSRIIMLGAYLIYYLKEESQILCMDSSLDADN